MGKPNNIQTPSKIKTLENSIKAKELDKAKQKAVENGKIIKK